MIFWTWLRSLRVADGAEQFVQSLVVEPGFGPACRLPGPQVATPTLDQQAFEPPRHVAVELTELVRGIPGPEVVAPSPQEQVQGTNGGFQLGPDPVTTSFSKLGISW